MNTFASIPIFASKLASLHRVSPLLRRACFLNQGRRLFSTNAKKDNEEHFMRPTYEKDRVIRLTEDPEDDLDFKSNLFNKKKQEQQLKAKANIDSLDVFDEDKKQDIVMESVARMSFPQLVSEFSRSLSIKADNPPLFYALIDRMDACVPELTKQDILELLNKLTLYRPKDEQKNLELQGVTRHKHGTDILNERHRELINQKSKKFKSLPSMMGGFVEGNLRKGLLSDFLKSSAEPDQLKMSVSDCVGVYVRLYENLEAKISDLKNLNAEAFSVKDWIDIMSSFGAAEEGTDAFYENMSAVLVKNVENFSIDEVEKIMNFFPHKIFQKRDLIESKLNRYFYEVLASKAKNEVENLNSKKFLNLFQGFTFCHEFPTDLMNKFFNSFIKRAISNDMSTDQVLTFLELLAQYLQLNPQKRELVDTKQLLELLHDTFISLNISSMSFREICGFVWCYSALLGNIDKFVPDFEAHLNKRISLLLVQKLKEKEKQPPTDIYDIDLSDLDTITYLLKDKASNSFLKNVKQAKGIMEEKLYGRDSSKWFHF